MLDRVSESEACLIPVRLPQKEHLLPFPPGPEDPTRYYYLWWTRYGYRQRLRMVYHLLGARRYATLLDLGSGGGIFLPALSTRCEALFAVDVHDDQGRVVRILHKEAVPVTLLRGRVEALPFSSGEFDAVTCVSVLEHLPDLEPALEEIHRVLKPNGVVIFGVPIENLILRMFFRFVGFQFDARHLQKHGAILAAIRRTFLVDAEERLPFWVPYPTCLYLALRCTKHPPVSGTLL